MNTQETATRTAGNTLRYPPNRHVLGAQRYSMRFSAFYHEPGHGCGHGYRNGHDRYSRASGLHLC
jgi:hypothetical protein